LENHPETSSTYISLGDYSCNICRNVGKPSRTPLKDIHPENNSSNICRKVRNPSTFYVAYSRKLKFHIQITLSDNSHCEIDFPVIR
jgi:hypothetical protein